MAEWDDLPDGFLQECDEIETQASQVNPPVNSNTSAFNIVKQSNYPSSSLGLFALPTINTLERLNQAQIPSETISGYSTSKTSSFTQLTGSQRKLRTPVKSLPTTSGSSQINATTEWLRSQLEKEKSKISELEKLTQSLKGENRILRDRGVLYESQVLKYKEKTEEEANRKVNEVKDENKELKKQLESIKMQLLLKNKEAAANNDRYKEFSAVSVVEPEYSIASSHDVSKRNHSVLEKRLSCASKQRSHPTIDPNVIEILSDDDEDQKDLLRFLARNSSKPKNQNKLPNLDVSTVLGTGESETKARECVQPIRDSSTLKVMWRLLRKSPWLSSSDSPDSEYSVDCGQLLSRQIGDKLLTSALPELKIIITPEIDYNPQNILKLDCSDLQYLKDLQSGDSVWGVDLKSMYNNSNSEEINGSTSDQTTEAIKTLLGSQVSIVQREDTNTPKSSGLLQTPIRHSVGSVALDHGKESILLPSLEPIRTHIVALTKLSSWRQSRDILHAIVLHITKMVNELYLYLCDPSIPNQIKDEFHKQEVAVGKLFMNGPYPVGDTLNNQKWISGERFVELRRGIALLSLICCLDRYSVNLLLQPRQLEEAYQSGASFLESKSDQSLDEKTGTLLINKNISKKIENLKNRMVKKPSCEDSNAGPSLSSPVKVNMLGQDRKMCAREFKQDSWILDQLVSLSKISKDQENSSTIGVSDSSSSSTVDLNEFMDIDPVTQVGEGIPEKKNQPYDGTSHFFKSWLEFYSESTTNTTPIHNLNDEKLKKISRMVNPSLSEEEKKQLNICLQRSSRFKEFFKMLSEGISGIQEDDNAQVMVNLFEYENQGVAMNKTVSSEEFSCMKSMPMPDVPKTSSDMEVDDDSITPASSGSQYSSAVCGGNNDAQSRDSGSSKEGSIQASFFERLRSVKGVTMPPKNAFERIPTIKDGAEEEFMKVLCKENQSGMAPPKFLVKKVAPLKKPLKGRPGKSPLGSYSDIQQQVEKEIELLYDQTGGNVISNQDRKMSRRYSSVHLMKSHNHSYVLTMNSSNFEDHFFMLYKKVESVAVKLGFKDKLRSFEKLRIVSKLRKEKNKLALMSKETGQSNSGGCQGPKHQARESDIQKNNSLDIDEKSEGILNMLMEETKKYDLNEHITSYEEKKGKLHILEGLCEIVSCVNYCRLTLSFYPLLASCVELIESLMMDSFHNYSFKVESLTLLMKLLNEVICCQPPPAVIGRILNVLMYASVFPETIECLCKNRSPLVSLVSGQEFCFFKGVCMMQPLCFLVGLLSVKSIKGLCDSKRWSISAALIRWLRLIYDHHSVALATLWYSSSTVCNCVPAQHNCVFMTLTAAAAYYGNNSVNLSENLSLRQILEQIIHDGVALCRTLVEIDPCFKSHLRDFDLYVEFIYSVKHFHEDSNFFPSFTLSDYELGVIDYLIKAEKRAACNLVESSSFQSRSVSPTCNIELDSILKSEFIFQTREQQYDASLK